MRARLDGENWVFLSFCQPFMTKTKEERNRVWEVLSRQIKYCEGKGKVVVGGETIITGDVDEEQI